MKKTKVTDKTVNDRMKRQRKLRLEAGWKEVRLWVPTKEQAKELQAVAKEMRKGFDSPSRRVHASSVWSNMLNDLKETGVSNEFTD